jgi:shikimate dehydrogenase
MKKACVIGWPIGHSRSPLIHNYWLKLHGIAGRYDRVPVEPKDLSPFFANFLVEGYCGCNVTIPHKEPVFDLVEIADAATQRLGAVNTVIERNGRLLGTNTDGEGFLANLKAHCPNLDLRDKRIVLLGAGGAAMAVVGALMEEGAAEIAIANRSRTHGEELGNRFGNKIRTVDWQARSQALEGSALLVNTTALGMTGHPPLEIDLSLLPGGAVVTDIVYSPLKTQLLQDAGARGYRAVGGLGMLLHQAVRGFELWFGTRPEVTEELYDLVARDIDPDYRR